MIRINQLKLPVTHTKEELRIKAAKLLKIQEKDFLSFRIVRQSIDARKKEEGVYYIYTVEAETAGEDAVMKKVRNPDIIRTEKKQYCFPEPGKEPLSHVPVIVGCGPAGLFSALMLARSGYRPVVLERGEDAESRAESVERFWQGGPLKQNSNVQFGEGGAGTFSDGKLNTLVKDPVMRNTKVLELFTEFGADPSILYINKPHIGTDQLIHIVKAMRQEIERLGGTVCFNSRVSDVEIHQGRITSVTAEVGGQSVWIRTQLLILAVGHSARDTFEMLLSRGVPMEQKSFAVGLRIQHPQKMITLSQYGPKAPDSLGAADYKLTYQTKKERGVYSFCMCPGGYVVNASSEDKRLAVNGMSYHDRDSVSANSALIVTVTPDDFGDRTPLGGIAFQRKLEEAAWKCGEGSIPVQLYGDFKADRMTAQFGDVEPAFKGLHQFGSLQQVLPPCLSEAVIEGVEAFDRKIKGFSRYDAILAGVESRTSSPVRIPRDERFESSIKGLYPCGEGAGYAGGITSAAMDGLKVAEAVVGRFGLPSVTMQPSALAPSSAAKPGPNGSVVTER